MDVLAAQVVWGCGDTFITGALEAWIASEQREDCMDRTFLRGEQLHQVGGIAGILLSALLGNVNLQLPIIGAGVLYLIFGVVLIPVMQETNFSPALEERHTLLHDITHMFHLNLRFLKGAPVLLILLLITFCGGLSSEGFDRLSTAHFINDTVMPSWGGMSHATWFGIMSLFGMGLNALGTEVLVRYLEAKGKISRGGNVLVASAGYIISMILFAFSQSFGWMLAFYLLTGFMRTWKGPVMNAWMNEHVDEKMRATVFSTGGQIDSLGQIIGGPIIGWIASGISVSWGIGCTALLLLPALFLILGAEKLDKPAKVK